MLTPIICPTCGFPIDDVAPIYRYIRYQRTKAARGNTLSAWAPIDGTFQVNMEDILDDLGITFMCCRIHLSTALVFNDFY